MSNYQVVGMGVSDKDYEHPKPLKESDMVLGNTYKLIRPRGELEKSFFEYRSESSSTELKGYFLRDGDKLDEDYSLSYADMMPASRIVNVDSHDVEVSKEMYEELNKLKAEK